MEVRTVKRMVSLIKTLVGIIILLIPFLYAIRFDNRMKGFLYMLTFFLAFHLATSIILQFFGVFNYTTVMIINVILCIFLLVDFFAIHVDRVKININYKSVIVIAFILVIVLTQFYAVHYNYTGIITTTNDFYEPVSNLEYPYPYFSDEWCAVSFIDYSISSGNLPTVNPLWHNRSFINIELGFHSFLSNFFLILDLEPLTSYNIFSIIVSTTICLLAYAYLRVNRKNQIISAIACLSVPHIISSGNLSTVWVLISVTMGVLCLLLVFIFISMKQQPKMIFISSILSLIFYPPLIVILGPVLLLYYYHFIKEHIKKTFTFFGIIGIATLLLYLLNPITFNYVLSKIFYPSFYGSFIPQLSIWLILPIPISVLSFVGIFRLFKEKQIEMVVAISIALIFWSVYAFVTWRFFIGNERIVFIASIFLTIASGFGIHHLYRKTSKHIDKHIIKLVLVLVLVFFVFLVPSYTGGNNFQKLVATREGGNVYFRPSSPANVFLKEDDLELFDGITGATFISSNYWKGLVIGVATNNFPTESKDSVITNAVLRYSDFRSDKVNLTNEFDIDYVYTIEQINISGYKLIGTSSEGFNLYRWYNE